MNVFTLLIFQGTDSVSEVHTIRAENVPQARRMVDAIMRTHPAAAGHQLWRDGTCISRTYPHASNGSLPVTRAGMQMIEILKRTLGQHGAPMPQGDSGESAAASSTTE